MKQHASLLGMARRLARASFGLAMVIGLGLASSSCGPDNHLYVPQDGGPPAATLTSYVIDLVNNHTGDTAPAAYASFQNLPDPDGDTNNTVAYSSLFP